MERTGIDLWVGIFVVGGVAASAVVAIRSAAQQCVSKKLNKAILRVNLVGRLTKTRRHTKPQHDADELDTFLWQTRSFKGYSFLNGVANCATN